MNKLRIFKPTIPQVNGTWKLIDEKEDGYMYRGMNGIAVIISGAYEQDGKRWIHVSFSRANRMPEYRDMKKVKTDFIGDRKAIMVFPEEKEFVNFHPYCLHLWYCLDGDGLPDFTNGTGSI